jgi:hypothetical protein
VEEFGLVLEKMKEKTQSVRILAHFAAPDGLLFGEM